jgi:hypothetical protein
MSVVKQATYIFIMVGRFLREQVVASIYIYIYIYICVCVCVCVCVDEWLNFVLLIIC